MKTASLNQILSLIITDSAVQNIQFVPCEDNTILNLNVGESDTDVSITVFHPIAEVLSVAQNIRKESVNDVN